MRNWIGLDSLVADMKSKGHVTTISVLLQIVNH